MNVLVSIRCPVLLQKNPHEITVELCFPSNSLSSSKLIKRSVKIKKIISNKKQFLSYSKPWDFRNYKDLKLTLEVLQLPVASEIIVHEK